MTYRIVLPRILIVSSVIGSRFLTVIRTVRREVFIVGVTVVIVPWTIVPFLSSTVTVSLAHFIRNLQRKSNISRLVQSHTICIRKQYCEREERR